MNRLALIAVLVAGCGVTDDDRPATLDFITATIFRTSCSGAECHSSFTQQVGDVFDTTRGARRSITDNELVVLDENLQPDARVPQNLLVAITIGLDIGNGAGPVRMPYDSPLPDADVGLIRKWIDLGAPGAQCFANTTNMGCVGLNPSYVFACDDDGNAGDMIIQCSGECLNGSCQ